MVKDDKNLREKNSEIPWREIIGMRNKIIHEYFAVDYEQVWTTIERDIPQFKSQVKKILEEKN